MVHEKDTTRTEAATERIKVYIRENHMMPGDRMPTETKCMEIFGVSRSTLREAVKMLAAMNILETRQGSGMFISERGGIPEDPLGLSFVYDDIRLELLDVRLLLEPQIAKLAATHATDAQVADIRHAAEEVEALIAKKRFYGQADMDFHRTLARASGNRVLFRLAIAIEQSIERNIAYAGGFTEASTIYYHRKIVEAIEKKNGVGAYYYMTKHLALFREHYSLDTPRAFQKEEPGDERERRRAGVSGGGTTLLRIH